MSTATFRAPGAFGRVLSPALLILAAGCRLTPEAAGARIDRSVAEITRTDVHGAVVLVDAPRQGLVRTFAHGLADVGRGTAMTAETPFLSASVGKLFIASAVLKLVADGRLSLDDPMTRHVPPDDVAGLPVQGGDAVLEHITVGMLLSHRSGLPDYFSDASSDGAPRLFDQIAAAPARAWTRHELLAYARSHYRAVGAPGERFHYADTNYDLLGMVLEGVTGVPFHRAVRALVLDPLGLRHTWYHAFESSPPGVGAPADVWVAGVNLRGAPALSVDQAGGGLATTVDDLRLFLRALADGHPVPLAAFDTGFEPDAMHDGIDVGRGAWRIRPGRVFFALAGMPVLLGHSGATGVWAYYARDWDAVLVGAVSDSRWQERHLEFLLSEVVPVLARVPRSSAATAR